MPNPIYLDMATENLRCPLIEQNRNFLNNIGQIFSNQNNQNMESENEHLDVLPLYLPESQTLEDGQPNPELQNNNSQRISLELPTSQTFNENTNWSKQTHSNDYQQRLMQISIREEPLTIQVTPDEEDDSHCWRPHLSNSSSSDILSQPLFQSNNTGGLSIMIPVDSPSTQPEDPPPLIQLNQSSSSGRPEAISRSSSQTSEPLVNIQSYLHSQKSQMNILKYEVLNAERNVCTARYEIEMLTSQLNDQLVLKNSQDIEQLSQENTRLRLECQCLCLEVDHYLKGKAPLGEVNEDFYHDGLEKPSDKADTSPSSQSDQPQEEEWECTTCTFANHPAINACEMCHMPRGYQEPSPFLSMTPGSCYCHPQVDLDSS